MNKISYMGDGETTEFFFDFPYFEDSNIIVTQNNIKITNFTVLGTRGGSNADIPFIGGKVVLEFAPSTTDCITITRKLSLERTVDYQPTAKIDPSTLNQDMNYTMEVLKDFQNDLTDFKTLNGDPTATQELLLKIDAVSQQISALGNITQIRDNISTLDTRTNGILDYVIETQAPTAENNYTWYRKYKSGWVEQGGTISIARQDANTSLFTKVFFPIEMSNKDYHVKALCYITDGGSTTGLRCQLNHREKKYMEIGTFSTTTITSSYTAQWGVCGFTA